MSSISCWKKLKRSGNFRKKVQANFARICYSTENHLGGTPERSDLVSFRQQIGIPSVSSDFKEDSGSINQVEETYNPRPELNVLDDESSDDEGGAIELTEISKNIDVNNQIRIWSTTFNISHSALRELFKIFNERIPNILPKDPRTLLSTAREVNLVKMENGYYWHCGLEANIKTILESVSIPLNFVSLNVNVDGLPIYKSSRKEFWPILCNIHEIPLIKPIIVGIYSGTGKPSDLDTFLRSFVNEMKKLLEEGVRLNTQEGNGHHLAVKLRSFICDSPARAFIKGVANFNAKHGCLKCTTIGEYSHLSRTVYFPRTGCEPRTDQGFRNKIYGNHHKYDSPLTELPIDMIEDFPVGDSLHLIDLGIMKRCLIGWRDGNFGSYTTKWCYRDITHVSDFLIKCKMPAEIHRATRGLDILAHWKGTEFRTFLYYISIVVLKPVLPYDVYQHFLLFFCAITICSSETHKRFMPLAESLLEHYVENYRDFYGEDFMTSNVHNLSHLVHEVKKFGVLATFNAYPFENRLYQIKKLLRTGHCPLSQIAKRLSEIMQIEANNINLLEKKHHPSLEKPDGHGQFKKIKFDTFLLNTSDANKWFLTSKNEIVAMHYAIIKNGKTVIYGKSVRKIDCYFESPIKSSYLNIYTSKADLIICSNSPLSYFDVNDLICKMVAIRDNNNIVFLPLMHTYKK